MKNKIKKIIESYLKTTKALRKEYSKKLDNITPRPECNTYMEYARLFGFYDGYVMGLERILKELIE